MPNFDSGRASNISGINIENRRGSDLTGIRFADNRNAPTSANDLVLYRRSDGLYFWDGTTEYNLLTGIAGGVGDLNQVYDGGHTINIDDGAIVFNDASAAALNVMEFNKTGAGSGNILDFDFSAAFTGNVLNLDMGSAVGAVGIVIDSEGGARTGVDLLFTDDSTGTHSTIQINKSGAGTSIAFEYVGSYNGSPAGQVFNVDLNANDNLDTEIEQFTTGAGARGIMFDYNFAHTDSGTTSHVWDIDMTGVFDSNVFDFATTAACTGNVFFINLDNGVAMTALHIEGSGARTQPMVEIASDSTGSASMVDITLTGAISGHVFEISLDTTSTGDVLNVDMNAAVGGRFLFLDGGAAIRTANMIDVTNDGSGNVDFIEVADSNTGSGALIDINSSGVGSGNIFDITYSAADTGNALNVVMADNVAGAALNITGAGIRTDSIIEVVSSETGSVDGMVLLQTTGVFTGHMLTVHSDAAATTGGLVHLDLDAGVAYKALTIDLAGARTAAIIQVVFDGTFGATGGGTLLDIDVSQTGASASPLIDIDLTSIYTGSIFDFATSSASTGTIFVVNMTNAVAAAVEVQTLAGTRTANANTVTHSAAGAVDIYQIDDSGTSSGHVWDVNVSGNSTGNVLDIVMSASKVAGHAIHVDLATDLAGNAILIDAAGTRTAPIIYIANTGADGGTDDHILFINQTGILDSNLVQLTFGTAASTGEALSIAMDTNVAGRAIAITSAATGVSGEGAGLDITHTGDLVAGANLVDIISTGNPSSTSHVLSLQQTTGAGTAGAYVLYINATGANVEALKVDAGAVVFDETLAVTGAATFSSTVATGALTVTGAATVSTTLGVTGATTLSSTLSYRNLTEVVTATNIITAAESGSVFFLASATEFVSTLPAVAAGLHFTFVVTAAPSGASYTIVTDNSDNIIVGKAFSSTSGNADSGLTDDTITFVDSVAVAGDMVRVWCDGTNWFAYAYTDADAAVTFTTAS